MLATLKRCVFTCKEGNFGLLAAFFFPVVLLAGGISIDLFIALNAKHHLQGAADAAALGALGSQTEGIVDALTNQKTGELTTSGKTAESLFLGNLGSSLQQQLTAYKGTVRREGGLITSEVTFSAAVPTTVLGVFNYRKIDVSGIAAAKFAPEKFYDFHILLDNSPSMGIGTTPADISSLETSTGCAFSCHNLDARQPKNLYNSNTYQTARNSGISVRIDVVSSALSRLIERASKKNYENQYRMALYSFGETAAGAGLTLVEPMTSKLNKVSDAAAQIQLMSVAYFNEQNHWLSDFDRIFTDLADAVKKQDAGDHQKVALIISDGMNDSGKSATDCKYRRFDGKTCWQPADPTFCQKMKDAGAKVAVLYTTFFPLPSDGNYRTYIQPWQPDIASTLSECASPGLFFEVGVNTGIDEALNALFSQITNTSHLTH